MNFLVIVNLIFTICGVLGGAIGGWSIFSHNKRLEHDRLQNESITALQARVQTLEGNTHDLKEKQEELTLENARLRQIIETIKIALLRKGIHITIDGETITVTDKRKHEESTTPLKGRQKAEVKHDA